MYRLKALAYVQNAKQASKKSFNFRMHVYTYAHAYTFRSYKNRKFAIYTYIRAYMRACVRACVRVFFSSTSSKTFVI